LSEHLLFGAGISKSGEKIEDIGDIAQSLTEATYHRYRMFPWFWTSKTCLVKKSIEAPVPGLLPA
jgi:hypothetical protein